MKNNTITLMLIAFTILSFKIFSNPSEDKILEHYKQLIISSFESAEETSAGMWSYELNKNLIVDGETETSIEKFNPKEKISKQWQLIIFNQNSPSTNQINEYQDEIRQKNKWKQQNGNKNDYLQFINMQSLKIESDTDDNVELSFDGIYPKFGNDAKGKIDGKLILDKHNQYVKHLKLFNNGTFSTKFVLHIKQWSLDLLFDKQQDAIMQKKRQLQMKATAAIFARVEVMVQITYGDYVYLGHN